MGAAPLGQPAALGPVGALIDGNVATWALSETMHRVEMRREGVREEIARFRDTVAVQVGWPLR